MIFTIDLLQLIMINMKDHFKCCHFQVGSKTFIFLSIVEFCSFMPFFGFLEAIEHKYCAPRSVYPHKVKRCIDFEELKLEGALQHIVLA